MIYIYKNRLEQIAGIYMEFNKRIKYILENELDRKQCVACHAIWFMFNHHGEIGYYRLGEDAPENCATCAPIDLEIEERSVISEEQWVSL